MNRPGEVEVLTGGRIVKAVGGRDGQPAMLFIWMQDGRSYQVEAWQDPEGNGPGFLSIGPIEGTMKVRGR